MKVAAICRLTLIKESRSIKEHVRNTDLSNKFLLMVNSPRKLKSEKLVIGWAIGFKEKSLK
jgi:hypothetical protein